MQFALLSMIIVVSARAAAACGGRLSGPAGVLQTPNFPRAFPVPLRCKWIIEHELPNGTISVYFTQQFTTSGLTFTEYDYYDDTYKLGERRAFAVTEENITRVKWLQVQSPILVVELSVTALEGTQLRALGLLNVFGLNVTYAVHAASPVTPQPPPTSCSALECRLLGHCYTTHDYQGFFCSCFEGYSGPDCGVGPLCAGAGPAASPVCKHGGLCRQMGPEAVSCICPPGYTGDLCETRSASPECGAECSESCGDEAKCKCHPRDTDNGSARFETTLQISEQPNLNISQVTISQLTQYLKASNITLDDEVEVLNISAPDGSGTQGVRVRVWCARVLADSLRGALARFTRARSAGARLLPATLHVVVQPALSLVALAMTGRPEVWQGSEMILSCTAYGAPGLQFTWYKDGVEVNFNATTRELWIRQLAEDEADQYTSVLGVSEASSMDSGRWSCVVEDAGRRRCRAIWLTVLTAPDIRLVPTTMTVHKGDNVSITCLSDARRDLGALGVSWARDRTLLRLAPHSAVWEDLYPHGSVLKLYNVQKSAEYRCQVSSVAGTSARGVTLWALGAGEEACEPSSAHGVRWPRTAPGATAAAPCPTNYVGEIIRFCEPKTIQRGVKWKLPDFSRCIASSLKNIYEEFQLISHGYSWKSLTDVIRRYESTLRSLPTHPGEGTIPLQHTRDMLNYLLSTAGKPNDKTESVEHILRILDTLLKHPDNFLDEEKVYDLQNALVQAAGMKENLEHTFKEFSVLSKSVREYNAATFKLPTLDSNNENWFVTSVGVELTRNSRSSVVVAVRYNNLSARLPSLKSSIEFRNGVEIEYLVASQHIQIAANGLGLNPSLPHTVTLLFTHIQNYSTVVSKLACGLRSPSEPRAWSTKACDVRIPEPTNVACQCRGLGTFALFTVARSTLTHTEKDLRGAVRITVGVGGALCLAATALQMLGLLPSRKDRLPVLLKAATAGTHSAAMFTLLECDNRQEEACGGALGWLCAACWCAGCAALCAQPLLLQTQLHTGKHHAPAVSLLAGLCTLAWLTARLWGGAPLRLGSSAQVVCAGACALLTLLCLALSVCAALRLRTITCKVPAERIKYFKSRRRIVHHTLVLLLTTSAAQAAGMAYAQPGEKRTAHVAALAGAAIANGVAMVVCYVFRDDQCLRAVRRVLSLAPPREWDEDGNQGDTSLSLYIKQGDEVESKGGVGVLESSPSHLTPFESYWRAPELESPEKIHKRRTSEPDCRADIVSCVEYGTWDACAGAGAVTHRDDDVSRRAAGVTRAVCDLVPRVTASPTTRACTLCARSTPDVSHLEPIKSCLKKPTTTPSSTTSPSPEPAPKLLERVNREWNKAYDDEPPADKVLHEISSDLDFLLNRTLENKAAVLEDIEEAPT